MKRGILVALLLTGSFTAVARMGAQAPTAGDSTPAKPADAARKPSEANPFPDDNTNIPVMPSKGEVFLPDNNNSTVSRPLPLPGEEADPVRSPDDSAPSEASGPSQDESSSQSGLDRLLPKDYDENGKRKRAKAPEHQETEAEDVEVGGYYLERKNWRAALSRFQSAMVLNPEDPEAFWGLAEAERHLNQFASARAHYQKLLDYDPDGPHGKPARKALQTPEILNGKDAPVTPSPSDSVK